VGLLLGAMIGGIALLVRSKNSIVRGAGIIGIGMPVILLAGSLFIFFVLGRNSAPGEVLGSLLRSGTAESRLINWKIALDGFSAKPFFGWGPENYEILFSKFYRPELVVHSYAETWSDRPHNILLEVATGSGVIGLVSYLAFLATPLWILLFRKMNSTSNGEIALFAGAIAAFLGQGLFLFDTFGALILFAAILALIDNRNANYIRMHTNDTNDSRHLHPIRIILAFVLIGFVIFGAIVPVKASIFAASSQRDIARRDYAGFTNNFLSALDSKTPHHDDLAKILADDILKGDASGTIPPNAVKSVLVPLADYLEVASNSHPEVYALVFRSAEVFALAGEYIDSKYFKKSEMMFERAEALSPRRQTTAIMRVQMELTRGNNDEARRRIVSLIETDPNFSEARWLYGLVLISAGEASAAEEQFDLFFNRRGYTVASPTTGGIFKKTNFILDFYASRGKFDKMVPILEIFISMYPHVADSHMRLAAVYASLGRFTDAKIEALKTLSLDPSRRKDVEEFISAIEEISNRP
jgi:tetratricopeptide (TPR) repeat protein